MPTSLTPIAGANGLTFTITRSIGTMPWRLELGHLGRDVAAGQDPGIDRVVEGLDLAADRRLPLGQVRDRRDVDAFAGEVLPRAVGREDLDVEGEQVAREGGDPIAVRD